MNDRPSHADAPSSDQDGADGGPASTNGQRHASQSAEPDLQAVLDAIAVRLDEVLAVPGGSGGSDGSGAADDAIEGHDGQAAPDAPRLDQTAAGQEARAVDTTADRARTDEAEQRLRVARERMTQRHVEAREQETSSATRTSDARRGVSWTAIGLIVIAALAAVVIVWFR